MPKRQEYSDGESEQLLIDYLSGKSLPKDIDPQTDWRFAYHLSPKRHALLNWLNFKPGASVLEIGSGPGAITGALLDKGLSVTALELSPKRTEINRLRHGKNKNLDLQVGNLQDYKPKNKFDYVVCVGVLEYAGLFVDGNQPHKAFLEKLKSLLNPDGVLVLAIENRFGLKYWAGAREDHTENFFDSLNDYPSEPGLQTFGKKELESLLGSSGFDKKEFYYPYPDYKMPQAVFSDDYLPGKKPAFPVGVLPAPTSSGRLEIFSEALVMENIEKNNLYAEFSNSFLVLATPGKILQEQPIFSVQAGRENKNFATQTIIRNRSGKLEAIKKPLYSEARPHITSLGEIYQNLCKIKGLEQQINITPVKLDSSSGAAVFDFVEGTSLERVFWDAVKAGDQKFCLDTLEHLFSLVDALPKADPTSADLVMLRAVFGSSAEKFGSEFVKPGLIDINFDNIIVSPDNKWNLIDYEWCFGFPVPKNYIIGRTLWWFFGIRYGATLKHLADRLDLLEVAPGTVVPVYVYRKYREHFDSLEKSLTIEQAFQSYVAGKAVKFNTRWKPHSTPIPATRQVMPLDELLRAREVVAGYAEVEAKLAATSEELANLKAEHQAVISSRGWRALEKARKVKRKVKRQK